ncbi:MAG: DUF4328 domain-containing protein [Streptomyces sp.]|nr:DUF4328 domain-containing protein [Streptomyces sp.]
MLDNHDLRPRPPLPAGAPAASLVPLTLAVAGLALVALCDVVSLVAGARLRSVIGGEDGFLTAEQAELDDALSTYGRIGGFQGSAYLVCVVAFIVWFFLMRRSTGLLAPDGFSRGRGWAIGAWAIPLANLWIPYRIALEMWAAASPLPVPGLRNRVSVWPVNLWWALFALSFVLERYAGRRYEDAETLMEIRSAVATYMTTEVVDIAAAVAAAYFAVRLTLMQRQKAIAGPFAPSVPPVARGAAETPDD